MLVNSEPLGENVNELNSFARLLVDATSTQTTGSRQYSAPSSRTAVASLAGPRRTGWATVPGLVPVVLVGVVETTTLIGPARTRASGPGAGTRRTARASRRPARSRW